VVIGIAGMEMMGAFAVAFQWILIQIEIAIVSSVGVFFLAFSTSRYTSQYSQGVLSYMFNVGAKLIAFQIFIAVATNLIVGQTIWNLAALATAAAVPDGIGSLVAVGLAAIGGFFALLIGALSIAVPGVASSFLTGATTVSGQAALSNAVAGMAGAQALRAGMLQESQLASQRSEHLARFQALGFSSSSSQQNGGVSMQDVTNTGSAAGTAVAPQFGSEETAKSNFAPGGANIFTVADTSGTVSPATLGGQNASLGADPALNMPLSADPAAGARAFAFNMTSSDTRPLGAGSGQTLYGMTADDMRQLPAAEFRSRLANTSPDELQGEIAQTIQNDPQLQQLALQQMREEAESLKVREAMAGNYAASGLGQMVPRGETPQSAVQVRIEHKD
jgi:hypothetical protein